jgi:hypothetical protein
MAPAPVSQQPAGLRAGPAGKVFFNKEWMLHVGALGLQRMKPQAYAKCR